MHSQVFSCKHAFTEEKNLTYIVETALYSKLLFPIELYDWLVVYSKTAQTIPVTHE